MPKYRVKIPFQDDMGSIDTFIATSSPMETNVENALWAFNRMREHDGLRPVSRLPLGTTFERIEED